MVEQHFNTELETEPKNKHIDTFLRKEPKILRKLDEMVEETNEFSLKQHLYFSLMKLTNDVKTFKSELIGYIANDPNIAQAIVKKATMMTKRSISSTLTPKITKLDVQKSIQRLGYGAVHNELQLNYAKQYVELFEKSQDAEFKNLIKKSVTMAFLTVELAKLVEYKDTTAAFFAGMNYFVAEQVLFLRERPRYDEFSKLTKKGLDAKTSGLASFGFLLGELAAKMLTKWHMPDIVIDVVSNKERPEDIRKVHYKLDNLLRFAHYVHTAIENPEATPASIWALANDHLLRMDLEIDYDTWQEEIKAIFIKVLETRYSLFNV